MTKEEYAQLYCLLGKLKYEIGIIFSNKKYSYSLMNDNLQKINELLTMPMFLSDDSKLSFSLNPLEDYLKTEDPLLCEKD